MDKSSSSSTLLKVCNLWKIFGEESIDVNNQKQLEQAETNGSVCAVRNVSFNANAGEVFVIMGLSGSGKSTLIRCLIRLIEPTAGNIIVNNENITKMNEKQLINFRRTQLSMVFQHYGLLPHRTVLDNVTFGLKLRGENNASFKEKAMAVIEKVGLAGWENHYPAQLSGGMQQRVGIARALVQDSDLLLMDEPFSGLDPLIRREMQDELIRLQSELNKTIIFVTHDLNEALRIGDRMAVMRKGTFVQVGTPQEIVHSPADEYVQRFVQDERKGLHVVKKEKTINQRKHRYVSVDKAPIANEAVRAGGE